MRTTKAEHSLHFYTETLGFSLEWNHQEQGRAYVFEVSLLGFQLILNQTEPETEARAGHGRLFIGLEDDQAQNKSAPPLPPPGKLVDVGADDPWRMNNSKPMRSSELVKREPIPAVETSGPLRLSDIPPEALRQMKAGAQSLVPHANDPPRDKLPPVA